MKLKARNRLTMLQALVVAEAPASCADRRAFVSVNPAEGEYIVVRCEFDRGTLAVPERWLAPGELLDRVERRVVSIDEVDGVVAELGADPDKLDVPWNSGYPL